MQGRERHGESREKVGRRQGGSLLPWELFFLDQRDDPEEDDGADDGGDDLSHEGAAPMDAEPAEDVAADEAADDADEEVNPKAEAGTFMILPARKPASAPMRIVIMIPIA